MYAVPTLGELMQKARQGFRKHLKGSDAWVWPNNLYVTAKVVAGATMEVMGFASYISQRIFAHTAPDIESLTLHGEEFGIPRKPAGPATGIIQVSMSAAGQIAAGAIFVRGDGAQYVAVSGGSATGAATIPVEVIASTFGAVGNSTAGSPFTILSGLTGGGDTVLAAAGPNGIAFGVDLEDIESWRERILFRKRNPPHGGAPSDYVMWAGQVPGVAFYNGRPTVFVERRWAGVGTVRVFPLMYDLYDSGIPQAADIARVQNYIDTVSPAGADVSVAAATPHVINITIQGLYPDTTQTREAIAAELSSAFKRLSRVAGSDDEIPNMPYLACPFVFSRSWIWQAVANASGEERHTIVTPSADIPIEQGAKPVLGAITFIS